MQSPGAALVEEGGGGEADAAADSSDEEYHDAVDGDPTEPQPSSQVLLCRPLLVVGIAFRSSSNIDPTCLEST